MESEPLFLIETIVTCVKFEVSVTPGKIDGTDLTQVPLSVLISRPIDLPDVELFLTVIGAARAADVARNASAARNAFLVLMNYFQVLRDLLFQVRRQLEDW
ncbi:hypothetical protein AE621_21470 [Acidovorax sp. SD340]|nr:hypothetical protein AE621_21470 [Acidovorax sp. SD340]